jgi:hypothetical protein
MWVVGSLVWVSSFRVIRRRCTRRLDCNLRPACPSAEPMPCSKRKIHLCTCYPYLPRSYHRASLQMTPVSCRVCSILPTRASEWIPSV